MDLIEHRPPPTRSAPADPAVRLDHLTRRFGAHTAVDDLTLTLPRGGVVGLVGPNGAGKTTLMAMLLGLVRPDEGSALVLGHPPARRRSGAAASVGALIEAPAFHPGLTGRQNLAYLARLGAHDVRQVPTLLDLVGLGGRGDSRYATYSLGMKQRLGIAAALLGDPALVILDEPANGVDPAGMRDIRDVVARIAEQGRTLLVSSHLLGELEQVCTWLVVLDHGRLLFAGPPQALPSPTDRLVLRATGTPASVLAGVLREFDAGVGSGEEVVVDLAGRDPAGLGSALNRAAHAAGMVLAELRHDRPDLQTRYLALLDGLGRSVQDEEVAA